MATITKVKSRSQKVPNAVRYQAIIRRKGVSRKKTFKTKAKAEAWARIMEADIETGKIHALNPSTKGKSTISDMMDKYETEKASKLKAYKVSGKYLIKRINENFGAFTYNDLATQHVVDYGLKRLQVIDGESFPRELSPLSDMIEHAQDLWGYPEKPNPVRHAVKVLRRRGMIDKGTERDRRPTDAEMDALYNELKIKNPEALAVIQFGTETGMRRGEICKLRWKDYDTETGCLLVHEENTKTREARRIPLTLRATLVLAAVKKPRGSNKDSLIFGYPDSNAVGKAFRRACARCKIEGLRFHDLRHEAISQWVESGLSIAEVRVLSGHKSLASLSRYANPTVKGVQEKLLKAEKKKSDARIQD